MATDFSKLNIKQLKTELAERGLEQTGKKAELIAKLESYVAEHGDAGAVADTGETEGDDDEDDQNDVIDDGLEDVEGNLDEQDNQDAEEDNGEKEEVVNDDILDGDENTEADVVDNEDELSNAEEVEEENEEQDQSITTAEETMEEEPSEDVNEDNNDEVVPQEEEPEAEEPTEENTEKEVQEEQVMEKEEKQKEVAKDKSTEEKEKTEQSPDEKKPEKVTRWLHVIGAKKLSKYRHLECVSQLASKRGKVLADLRSEHRIRVFPLTVADLALPAFVELTKKCSLFSLHYNSSVDGENVKTVGCGTFLLKKMSDHEEFVKKVKSIREDFQIHTAKLKKSVDEFNEEMKVHRTVSDQHMDDTTLFMPTLPSSLTEDDLWEMFPTAWEIGLHPAVHKTKYTPFQPSYGYVYFPNREVSQHATKELGMKPPVKGLKELDLIPLTFLKNASFFSNNPQPRGIQHQLEQSRRPRNVSPARASNRAGSSGKPTVTSSIFSAEPVKVDHKANASGGQKAQSSRQDLSKNQPRKPAVEGNRQRNQPNQGNRPNQPGNRPNQPRNRPNQPRNRPNQPRNQSPRGNRNPGMRSQSADRMDRFSQRPRLGGVPMDQMSGAQQEMMLGGYMPPPPPPLQQRDMSDKEQGLKVLGSLLSTIGKQGDPNQAADVLLEALGGQQRQQERGMNRYDQPRESYGGRRSPKRAHSPDMGDNLYNKRRRESAGARMETLDRRFSGGTGSFSTPSRQPMSGYDAQPGYRSVDAKQQGRFSGMSERQPSAQQPSADMKVFDSLNVVSRIVRASKELKDAMKKGDPSGFPGQGQSFPGQGPRGDYNRGYNQDRGYDQHQGGYQGGY